MISHQVNGCHTCNSRNSSAAKPVIVLILIEDDIYSRCTIARVIIIKAARSAYVMWKNDHIICTLHGSGSFPMRDMSVSCLIYVMKFAFFFRYVPPEVQTALLLHRGQERRVTFSRKFYLHDRKLHIVLNYSR